MSDQSKPVVLSPEAIAKLGKMAAENPGLLPYAHHTGSAVIAPTEAGAIKAQGLQAMAEQTGAVMGILAEFMQVAMKHATQVKDRIEVANEVYEARMAFTPLIGKEYFLYEKASGERILSLISPEEWGASVPYARAVARVRLLADHTWDVSERYS